MAQWKEEIEGKRQSRVQRELYGVVEVWLCMLADEPADDRCLRRKDPDMRGTITLYYKKTKASKS